jgi:hypothetical protein
MWTILAAVVAMALFSVIALSVDQNVQTQLQNAVVSKSAQQSALMLAQFANAAHQYAQSSGAASGTQITVQTLVSAGNLPNGFPLTDAFGQPFIAVVGNTSATATPVAAYYSAQPTDMKGLPVNIQTISAVELRIAQNAAATQQLGLAQVGIAPGNGQAALQLPFSTTKMSLSSSVPQFTPNFPSAAIVFLQ